MIRSVKWNNHPVLGNLEINFVNQSAGKPYNTIVLAGDNGTGKTTILETLVSFYSGNSFFPFSSIEYEQNGSIFRITPYTKDGTGGRNYERQKLGSGIEARPIFHAGVWDDIRKDKEDPRTNGFAYSKARSGFVVKNVTQTSGLSLDNEPREDDRQEDFTSIKQLLIDIDTQDNSDLATDLRDKTISGISEHDAKSRISRFTKAFNGFFDDLHFRKIKKEDGNVDIYFQKEGKSIKIDQLSTGEKQIVFRGSLLLKNEGKLNGGVIFVDEPELSLHPKWQQKILNFYRSLFSFGGRQDVQMIFATHSEYVIKSALEDRDNVLVLVLSESRGVVSARSVIAPFALPVMTTAETNYLAFGATSVDYHIELYSFLMSLSSTDTISSFDNFLKNQPECSDAVYQKVYSYQKSPNKFITYLMLPTYIRNCIDHPDSFHSFSEIELNASIAVLIKIIQRITGNH